ncbi:hypothetical protein BJF92_18265 [Rhizobium rhizosphaerae]|uniref:Uncharacterized protein n=1 Tax=Xaviernesmea rhizosphaerae TaxID=1672749 RepID=A0A1Q9ADI4_9HYPH|nr:hypothetical protein [Xaviernesmea rhizosphaerae]OLP52984.1 hypothetical protein BJF92_18265 [Xaviernesmea rhizosphaerae]
MTRHQRALEPHAPVTAAERRELGQLGASAQNTDRTESTAAAEEAWLDLLLPNALPAEAVLEAEQREGLHTVLCGLVKALALNPRDGLPLLSELLQRLDALGSQDESGPEPVAVDTTGLPLTAFQASDYDRYFRVNRVAPALPATMMVRSLVQAIHAVTDLFARSADLPERQVRGQIEGFVAQAHLLARALGLERLR